jgi:hypothetical protein
MAGAYPYLSSPFAVPPHLRAVIGAGLEHSDSILLSPGETFAYSSTPLRWWVLAVFSLLGFMQSFIWLTYSPITNKTEDYYGISEGAVDLTLNWGPIIALPVTPLVMQWASNSAGVRRLVFVSVWLELLACALRLIPEFGGRGSALHAHALWFIHPAHILNAAAGPMIQASITKISCLWFPAAERTSATAVLIVSANVGSAAGFLIAPAMVTEAGDMPKLLLLQAGLTVLIFLAVFPLWPRLFFPARPDFFPSRAAAEMEMGVTEGQGGGQGGQTQAGDAAGGGALHESLLDGTDGELLARSAAVVANPRDAPNASLWNGSKFAFSNRSFVLLALSNGLLSGVFNGWTGVLSTVMPSDDFSDSTCGWLSFTATMAGCVAGVAVGPLTERVPSLRRKLKALVLAFTLFAALCAGVFMLLTPSVFSSRALLSHMAGGKQGELALMFVAIALFGACIGASAPLTFELSVELTFPAWESISGGTLSFLINVGSLVFLAVAPALSGAWMTALMTLSVILCAAMLLPVREKYWRMDHEEGRNGSNSGGDDDGAINGPVYIDGLSSRASVFTNGGGGSDGSRSVSQQRRGGGLAAHEADLHEEFARIMHQVDDGMAAPSASPPILA